MFVEFDQMPGESRVWVFQADRALNNGEAARLEIELRGFLTKWTAHGDGLLSSSKVFHNRFVVISTDEDHARASGCSIDSMTNFVRRLGTENSIDFFNRTKIAFLKEGQISVEDLASLKEKIEAGQIGLDTPTFNNLVADKQSLEKNWVLPASKTWLSRYF